MLAALELGIVLGFKERRRYLIDVRPYEAMAIPPVEMKGGVRPQARLPDHAYAYICMSQGVRSTEITPEDLTRRESQSRAAP